MDAREHTLDLDIYNAYAWGKIVFFSSLWLGNTRQHNDSGGDDDNNNNNNKNRRIANESIPLSINFNFTHRWAQKNVLREKTENIFGVCHMRGKQKEFSSEF